MKTKGYFILLCVLFSPFLLNAQSYKSMWKKVEQSQHKDLPKTTLEWSSKIYRKAEKEKNIGQLFKAGIYSFSTQLSIERDSLVSLLIHAEKTLKEFNSPIEKALMHSLLAEGYVLAKNEFSRSSRTLVDESLDLSKMRSWSDTQFIQKIVEHADASVNDRMLLLKESGRDYIPFIEMGETSTYFNHDLYHLLAQRRIDLYNTQSRFYNLSSVYDEEFWKDKINTAYDEFIDTYKESKEEATLLFVLLAKWEQKEKNTEAFLELDDLIDRFNLIPEVVELYKEKAVLNQYSNPDIALAMCNEAIRLFPKYYRINNIHNIKEKILLPHLTIYSNALVYPGERVDLNIKHKNLEYFTLEWYLIDSSNYSESISGEDLLAKSTFHSSLTFDLTPPSDYKSTDTTLTVTAPPLGRYLLRVVADCKNTAKDYTTITSTRFRVLNTILESKENELIVLDNKSGHPIRDAKISVYNANKEFVDSYQTNERGLVTIKKSKSESYYYLVSKDDDRAMDYQSLNYGGWYQPVASYNLENREIKLLTDRAIYRPGQTVYVKGVAYAFDEGKYTVLPSQSYTVQFYDASQNELNKNEVKTNEYGSFTTSFQIPSVTLNGMFLISTQFGSVSVRVEEYKRPSFELAFDTLKTSYQLGDEVLIKGAAKTFSGLPITEGEVSYTLSRSLNVWRFIAGRSFLASGTVPLNNQGAFEIPIELVSKNEDPIWGYYTYTLEASLTNVAGETQTQTFSLSAGKRSLLLNSTLSNTLCKDELIITTFEAVNLSQNPIAVQGSLKLYKGETETNKWDESSAELVFEDTFKSNEKLELNWKEISSGAYKLVLTADDSQNREARFEQDIYLFSMDDKQTPVKEGAWLYSLNSDFDEDHPAKLLFGTAEKNTYVVYNIYSADKRISSQALNFDSSFGLIEIPYLPEYKDGLILTFSYVKEGTLYEERKELKRRVKKEPLNVKWEVFRDRLSPGQKEEWKITLLDTSGKPVDAEFLASMYDASLDQIWSSNPIWSIYSSHFLPYVSQMNRYTPKISLYYRCDAKQYKVAPLSFDSFFYSTGKYGLVNTGLGYGRMQKEFQGVNRPILAGSAIMSDDIQVRGAVSLESAPIVQEEVLYEVEADAVLDHSEEVRSNFGETAFFYPQLRTNEKGEIVFEFTVPEQLTRWNFRGYAHTKNMNLGELFANVVTAKEFSIQPYYPRFVRQGDKVVLSAVLSNQSDALESGEVSFVLFDPFTDKIIQKQKQPFSITSKGTKGIDFTFNVSEEYDVLGCRIIANGKQYSDGEQQVIPVLERRVSLVESETFVVRDEREKQVSLNHLFNKGSETASNKVMTLEFSGNPTWFAIQSLPALQQPKHESAVAWVSSLYANQVASFILNSKPQLKATLDAWQVKNKGKEDLLTPLIKNKELKNILIEESPWLLDAKTEAEQQARLQTLFDLNQVADSRYAAEVRLQELQQSDGAWSWYKGMTGSKYITTFVLETLMRLDKLTGIDVSSSVEEMKLRAIEFIHREAKKEFDNRDLSGSYYISNTGLSYLYLVALGNVTIPREYADSYAYYLNLVPQLLKEGTIAQKAKAAFVLAFNNRKDEAKQFVESLQEYLVQTEEKGMYFSVLDRSSLEWDQQKIASHVYVIEAFDELVDNKELVNEMKLWLLSQKRTQQWDTPIETVNAVYALLFRGRDDFSNSKKTTISWDSKKIDVQKSSLLPTVSYLKQEIKETGKGYPIELKIKQENKGISWGAVYAQFQEDLSKVQSHGKELLIEKSLYVERTDEKGKSLIPLSSAVALKVGDVVVSRLILTADRALDFVHLKDQRGACFEPLESLSGHRSGEKSSYYTEIKDASTHYFFDYLPKGVQVVENRYRVVRVGEYEGGIATLQSAYAPEFTSYAASQRISVTDK